MALRIVLHYLWIGPETAPSRSKTQFGTFFIKQVAVLFPVTYCILRLLLRTTQFIFTGVPFCTITAWFSFYISGCLGKLPLQRKKKSFIHNFKWFVKFLKSFVEYTENTMNCWQFIKNLRIILKSFISFSLFCPCERQESSKAIIFLMGKYSGFLLKFYIDIWTTKTECSGWSLVLMDEKWGF